MSASEGKPDIAHASRASGFMRHLGIAVEFSDPQNARRPARFDDRRLERTWRERRRRRSMDQDRPLLAIGLAMNFGATPTSACR
jgi:hypothetical protein